MDKPAAFYFIDKLGVARLLRDVLPAMREDIFRRRRVLFCLESSAASRGLARVLGIEYRDFDFRFLDIRDEDGCLWWLKVFYFDLTAMFGQVAAGHDSRQKRYALKKPMVLQFASDTRLGRSLFFIRAVHWSLRHSIDGPTPEAVHILIPVPSAAWLKPVRAYGEALGIMVRRLRPAFDPRAVLNSPLGRWMKNTAYYVYARVKGLNILKPVAGGPALMAEYYGQLNLNDPQFYCDLFFYDAAILGPHKTFLTFNLPRSPLDESMMGQLSARAIEPVLLHPKAARVPGVDFYPGGGNLAYNDAVAYWRRLFARTGTKVYTSWFKYSEEHMAIAEGIRKCGGVATIYQRAFEEFGNVESMVDTDIVFGFSPWHAQVEQQAHSRMAYHVAVGYVGDHRFALTKDIARQVRGKLQERGARNIMAYFDENSHGDTRWYYGHGSTRAHYAFLLEKVLQDQAFGLVLKPKVPSTLRQRLGPVSPLLEQALQTGRCFMFEAGSMHGAYAPAAAAQCADIAVHGYLYAATAALEAALAGTPTLMLDREGWKDSLFHRLKKGRVVFGDWPQLWEACQLYWKDHSQAPGLGDWSEIMDDMDPFRDGQAARRMATYMAWLLEGFKQGLDREEAMAQACERYGKKWGKDKIATIFPRT